MTPSGIRVLATSLCCSLLLAGCAKEPDRSAPRDRASAAKHRASTARSAPRSRPARSVPATGPATRPATRPTSAPADAARLPEALRRIVALEQNGEWAQAWKLALQTRSQFAGRRGTEELARVTSRLRIEKRQAAQLANAVRLLDSDMIEAAQIATSELAAGGDVAAILLRKALRTGGGKAAARAVRILARRGDPNDAQLFWSRLQARPDRPLREALLAGLQSVAWQMPGEAAAALYRDARDASLAESPDSFALLALAFRTAADADPEKFGRLVGDAEAHETVRRKVSAALSSADEDLAASAARILADLGAMRAGLRGAYYEGKNFEKLLFERLDAKIDIADLKLPYPDGRQENRSIRWTGQVRIPAAGPYTFYAASDDGVRLWVAGKQLIDQWTDQAVTEVRREVALAQGLHPIKLEYYQGTGSAEVHLHFSGPGLDKQLLTAKHLVTAPWESAGAGTTPKN